MGEDLITVALGHLRPAIFRERPNRFVGIVEIDGRLENAHIMDSGRLKELLVPGNTVMVRKARRDSPRRTAYDLVLASYQDILVSIDTRYPYLLLEKALKQKALPEFRGYSEVFKEVRLNHALNSQISDSRITQNGKDPRRVVSRLDFALHDREKRKALVEVKSVTLAEDGLGLFPDAPTDRGKRHLHELIRAKKAGCQTYVVFIAQREDIKTVSPNWKTDPEFAKTLLEAVETGVTVLAYGCVVTPFSISLKTTALPVTTGPRPI